VSKHNYENPSEKQDLSHLEASVEDVDEHGFSKRKPISDRECIYKCLDNNRALAGLDRKQVERLCKEFAVEKTDEEIKNEYPPL
jgi:hypothetical protein|tara:strand:+ start:276 stop:527 length:252 start_codon:yes stop_codon:yes gene_type:complete